MSIKRWVHCVAIVLAASLPFRAEAGVSIESFRQSLVDFDWNSLERGDIVRLDMPALEVEPSAIAVVLGAKLQAPADQVLEVMQKKMPDTIAIEIDTSTEASIRRSLERFAVSPTDTINLRWFQNPVADGSYNVNREELAILQRAAPKLQQDPNDLSALNSALREFFYKRLQAYRQSGLAGILPYDIDGSEISAGDYLASSLQPIKLIQKQEPAFYQAFLNYPKKGADAFQHRFFLMIEKDGAQQIVSLKHWMLDLRGQSALIAERKFYISHSLDAMHTLIYLEQQGKQSYLLLGNTTFTEKVTGIGSFIAHKVGRAKITESVKPMLIKLQQTFNKAP